MLAECIRCLVGRCHKGSIQKIDRGNFLIGHQPDTRNIGADAVDRSIGTVDGIVQPAVFQNQKRRNKLREADRRHGFRRIFRKENRIGMHFHNDSGLSADGRTAAQNGLNLRNLLLVGSRSPVCARKQGAACLRREEECREQNRKYLFAERLFHIFLNCLYTSLRPIKTPMEDAIMRPLVQPDESPRQYSPRMLVVRSGSILTLLE